MENWPNAKKLSGKKQKFLEKAGNSWLNQEPHAWSSGPTKKSENGYLTGYHEDENSPDQVPNREAFFLLGSWLGLHISVLVNL